VKGVKIAGSTITWIEFTPKGIVWKAPEEEALSQVAQAGYEGVPISPMGGRTAQETVAQLARYGLKPAPSYLGASFWDKGKEQQILERARSLARFSREAGCTELYVAAEGFNTYTTARGKTRNQIAANVQPEDAMTEAEWAQFASALNRVGEITLEQGVKSCFHNHVGSTIETRAEIDRLFSMIDRSLVFQGPDIGHLAWAGADPVQFCRDYADSIKTMHIKDINPAVMQEGVEKEWNYSTFSAHGIFAEIGEGMVDFPAMFSILKDAGFQGWVVVETDVTTKPTPLESAIISRNYLKSIGL
jgi:inosose dehydratase